MAKDARLIHANGPFEVYKIGAVLIIYEDGEFSYNLRKTDDGYYNVEKRIADTIALRAELEAERIAARAARRAAAAERLAEWQARKAAQPHFEF